MEHYFYNFSTGVNVYNSLNDLHRDHNSTSFLISAVGDLSKVSFKCPLNDNPLIIAKKLEIITLSGYTRSYESHLHISVSDEDCRVFGGHLLSGKIVLKSLDVLIGIIPNLNKKSFANSNHKYSSVHIYVLPDCPCSKRAIKLLLSSNIKYNSYVINNDEEFNKNK